MNLHALLLEREAAGRPVTVGLIGAGKFGTMFLAQARLTKGLHVVAVADLNVERARQQLAIAGWPAEQFSASSLGDAAKQRSTHVTADAAAMIAHAHRRSRPSASCYDDFRHFLAPDGTAGASCRLAPFASQSRPATFGPRRPTARWNGRSRFRTMAYVLRLDRCSAPVRWPPRSRIPGRARATRAACRAQVTA